MTRYAKTVLAVLGAISAWGVTAFADGDVSAAEWFGLVGVLAAALGVYFVPNRPPAGKDSDPGISEQDPQVA